MAREVDHDHESATTAEGYDGRPRESLSTTTISGAAATVHEDRPQHPSLVSRSADDQSLTIPPMAILRAEDSPDPAIFIPRSSSSCRCTRTRNTGRNAMILSPLTWIITPTMRCRNVCTLRRCTTPP